MKAKSSRTTLLIAALSIAATTLTCHGFPYTVTVQPGLDTIANHLDHDFSNPNTLDDLFPGVPLGTKIYIFNGTSLVPSTYELIFIPIPPSMEPGWVPNQTLDPGVGAFIDNPSSTFFVTFTGTERLPVPLDSSAGFHFVSSQTANSGTYVSIMQGYPKDNTKAYTFIHTVGYKQHTYTIPTGKTYGSWYPLLQVPIGKSVWFEIPLNKKSARVNSETSSLPFAISDVQPPRIGNVNGAVIMAFGGGFPVGATLRIEQGSSIITPTSPTTPSLEGYLTSGIFDLSGIGNGTGVFGDWDVVVHDPSGTPSFRRVAGIKIVPAGIVLNLNAPPKVPKGKLRDFTIDYENASFAEVDGVYFTVTGIPPVDQVEVDVSQSVPPCTVEAHAGGQRIRTTNSIAIQPGDYGQVVFSLTVKPAATITDMTLRVAAAKGSTAPPLYETTWPVEIVASMDPNEKLGPGGHGPEHAVMGTETFNYQVRYENESSATTPVQEVLITDQLDTDVFDLSTFMFTRFSFGNTAVSTPVESNPHTNDVPFDVDGNPTTTNDNIIVRIVAGLQTNPFLADYGVLTCSMASLDPATGLPPLDPNIGFLPPNQNPPEGEGGVAFRIKPLSNLASGALITNTAKIESDANPPIWTPVWTNRIDHTIRLNIAKDNADMHVWWRGAGALQTTPSLSSSPVVWTNIPSATSPYTESEVTTSRFFRVHQ